MSCRWRSNWLSTISLLFAICLAPPSHANGSGNHCENAPPTQSEYEQAIQLGFKTQHRLEQLYQDYGDHVVLIARIGSASPKKRFIKKLGPFWNYTHAGIAYRNHPRGQWTVVHLLNTCNEKSDIFAQGLMRFSLDRPHQYKNAIGRLAPQLQQRLEEIIVKQDLAKRLHSKDLYSSISSPYNLRYQNSNEYILATLVTALAPDHQQPMSRAQAKHYFLHSHLEKQFEPELTKVSFFERLGKSLGVGPGNASLDDHSRKERVKGQIQMVSVGSLFNFLNRLNKLVSTTEITL